MSNYILVTGGAGYIGSHACKVLAEAGYVPITLDNLSTGNRWSVKWGPSVEGNLADGDLLRKVIRKYSVSAVIHFAANAYVRESVVNPRKYFENNASNTLHLLGAMLDTDINHIVFSSTCATYGLPKKIPITENEIQQPISPYGESKLFIERVLRWYADAYSLNWMALRYFNAAGADSDGEIGEYHDPETHLIPLVIQSAMGCRPEVEIYGIDHPTHDGTPIRDYIHVTDLAKAHVLSLEYLKNGGKSGALNLGTGIGHSVMEVISAVKRISGLSTPFRPIQKRPGDAPVLVADASKARQTIGWVPKFTDLHEIVETAWKWHKEEVNAFIEPPNRAETRLGGIR
jgi:UDP-glucose-4-epimerase GalE